MENSDPTLEASLLRKSQVTQLALADALVAVSKATITSIEAMEALIADEDNSPELRSAIAEKILSRTMPERAPHEGAGAPTIDFETVRKNFVAEMKEAL